MPEDSSQPHPRPRRPRGSLTPERILDAAEALAEQGFGAVSMRGVAGRLGAAPMALYNHFGTREQLVGALLDRVLGRFAPDPPTDDWAEDLRRFARAHRRLLSVHPWAVAPLFAKPIPGPSAQRIGGHALAILERGGHTGDRAIAAFSGLIALNYGWSSFAVGSDLESRDGYGSDEHYELVLGALVDGLAGGSTIGR